MQQRPVFAPDSGPDSRPSRRWYHLGCIVILTLGLLGLRTRTNMIHLSTGSWCWWSYYDEVKIRDWHFFCAFRTFLRSLYLDTHAFLVPQQHSSKPDRFLLATSEDLTQLLFHHYHWITALKFLISSDTGLEPSSLLMLKTNHGWSPGLVAMLQMNCSVACRLCARPCDVLLQSDPSGERATRLNLQWMNRCKLQLICNRQRFDQYTKDQDIQADSSFWTDWLLTDYLHWFSYQPQKVISPSERRTELSQEFAECKTNDESCWSPHPEENNLFSKSSR